MGRQLGVERLRQALFCLIGESLRRPYPCQVQQFHSTLQAQQPIQFADTVLAMVTCCWQCCQRPTPSLTHVWLSLPAPRSYDEQDEGGAPPPQQPIGGYGQPGGYPGSSPYGQPPGGYPPTQPGYGQQAPGGYPQPQYQQQPGGYPPPQQYGGGGYPPGGGAPPAGYPGGYPPQQQQQQQYQQQYQKPPRKQGFLDKLFG